MYFSPCIEEDNKKNRNKIGAKMKTLEAKPFDQNAENWKRANRLFTSTVLEAGASGKNRIGTHASQKSSNSLIRFRCSNSCFLLETDIAGHQRLFLAKWHLKAEKKLRRRPFFDIADRHEKLYGRSRLYASAQRRYETDGVLLLFSSLSFDISMKNSVQRGSSDIQGLFSVEIRKMALGSNLSTLPLRGAWRYRDPNDIFAHCSHSFYFFDFKFPTLFVLLNFILWFGSFFKNPSGKSDNARLKQALDSFQPASFLEAPKT